MYPSSNVSADENMVRLWVLKRNMHWQSANVSMEINNVQCFQCLKMSDNAYFVAFTSKAINKSAALTLSKVFCLV